MVIDDTDPQLRRVQIDCLQGMTIEQRLAMAVELSAMTTHLSREASRATMPAADESAVLLRWIELVYGAELARRVAPSAHRLGRLPHSA